LIAGVAAGHIKHPTRIGNAGVFVDSRDRQMKVIISAGGGARDDSFRDGRQVLATRQVLVGILTQVSSPADRILRTSDCAVKADPGSGKKSGKERKNIEKLNVSK